MAIQLGSQFPYTSNNAVFVPPYFFIRALDHNRSLSQAAPEIKCEDGNTVAVCSIDLFLNTIAVSSIHTGRYHHHVAVQYFIPDRAL